VEYVAEKFKLAQRPVVFIGGGVRSSGAISEVKAFVEENHIPVVYSPSAADAYGSANALSIGAVGSIGGSRAGNFTVQNADFILVLGSKLCSQTTGAANQFARKAEVVVVDIDPLEHTKKGVDLERIIHADIKQFMLKLLGKNIVLNNNCTWVDKCLHWKSLFAIQNEEFIKELLAGNKIDLYYFADILSDKLSDDAAVITDAGLEELIIPSTVRFRTNQRCIFPAAQGAMGYAIPAVLGVYFGGKRNIVAVVGDGSFTMNMQELLAIRSNNIPVKIFVINNNMYAVIRKRQKDLFRARTLGNDPSDGLAAPDFKSIAECFGFSYKKICEPENLADDIESVLKADGAWICEVICVEEQKYLHMSFAINDSHRMVKRPLEDMSPFIDRDLFYSEMVVAPEKE
jgi:acetolactate synthase-1/2/3 large subunit